MKKVQEYKSLTANPAGNLVIKETGKPYKRSDFVGDLKKVSKPKD